MIVPRVPPRSSAVAAAAARGTATATAATVTTTNAATDRRQPHRSVGTDGTEQTERTLVQTRRPLSHTRRFHFDTVPAPSTSLLPSAEQQSHADKMVHLVVDFGDMEAKLIDAKEKLVIIDFFAKWCGPCKLIAPFIEELANDNPDVVMLKVDVDECEEAAIQYNIQSMPTFVFIKSNKEVKFKFVVI
ncbi:Hypothetical protein CINCED_3A025800 [Cinara cedri]|uniref:Thioredoxin domain-containing protein n=1 Tax=Cinara cedri TaxID=506608 RepID=A0A5E4NCV8_9HEMI|nr:Hypothetical protein CINCED_3A025800 [Cinara cedri]